MKTMEELKRLNYEDFMAPNQILCYGGGGLAAAQIPRMLRSGMNITGVIDQNKSGIMICGKYELPYCSVAQAVQEFGTDVIVIITIANKALYPDIIDVLMAAGIKADRIYDYDVYNWITVPQQNCYCPFLFQNLYYDADGIRTCCFDTDDIQSFVVEPFNQGIKFEENMNHVINKMKWYYEQARRGNVPFHCNQCPYLVDVKLPDKLEWRRIVFGAHNICNMDCIYCDYANSLAHSYPFFSPTEDGENFLRLVERLDSCDLLSKTACIDFGGGELSVMPMRQQFLELARNYAAGSQVILSNCAVYSKEIAEILSLNENNLLECDLDAGTPETYVLVKGYDCFNQVIENLKQYSTYGNIQLKYIVMPGFNTSQSDYLGQIKVLNDLGLKKLRLSPEGLHEKSRFDQRKTLYEMARFMVLLKEHGIQAELQREYMSGYEEKTLKRLYMQLLKAEGKSEEQPIT